MPARLWHDGERLPDNGAMVRAFGARLRERISRAAREAARARRPVADRPQRPYAQIIAVEPDPDRSGSHPMFHDAQTTSSFTDCAAGCGRVLRAPLVWCPIEWTCGDCLQRQPLAPVIFLDRTNVRLAGTIGGAHPTRNGGGCE